MITLISGASWVDGVAVRQKIGTASHKKRRILETELSLRWLGFSNKSWKIHVRVGRAHRITESFSGNGKGYFKSAAAP